MVSATGFAALVLFALHNALAALLMRYTRLHHRGYNEAVAVFLQEAVIKLPCCVALYWHECGGLLQMMHEMAEDFRIQPKSWFRVALPALLYTIQNNLVYFGYSHLDPAVGMMTYQSKLLFTALASVYLLGKRLGSHQWAAVLLLCVGVMAVHAMPPEHSSSAVPTKRVKHEGGHHVHKHAGPMEESQQPLLGAAAFLVAAMCTASASVYFEWMIKVPTLMASNEP